MAGIGAAASMLGACSSSGTGPGSGGFGNGGKGGASGDGSAASGNSGGSGAIIGVGKDGGTGAGRSFGGPDGSCGGTKVESKPKQVNVLLVIDRSGSMNDPSFSSNTVKWSAMKTALTSALTTVQADTSLWFGLELFPYPADPAHPSTDQCEMPAAPGIQVDIAEGSIAVPKIKTALGMAPGGGTPTALALSRAADYFRTGKGSTLAGDKYVLLATDGGPNCNPTRSCDSTECVLNLENKCTVKGADGGVANCCDPQFGGAAVAGSNCLDVTATNDAIKKLADEKVKTFVVGIPGSDTYKTALGMFADTGGEVNPSAPPDYYEVSGSGAVSDLTKVLTSITQGLITTCRQQLTSQPIDIGLLSVYLDKVKLTETKTGDGWYLDNSTSPSTVVLTGKTCTQVETSGAGSLQVWYGCPIFQ